MDTLPAALTSNKRLDHNPSTTRSADDDWLTTGAVCNACGGVSAMTLWRWTRQLGFPRPDRILNGRKYWLRSTVAAWKARDEASEGKAA